MQLPRWKDGEKAYKQAWGRLHGPRIKERKRRLYQAHRARHLKRHRQYYAENGVRIKQVRKVEYAANPQKKIARSRAYALKHPTQMRDKHLRRKYGITVQDRAAMLIRQQGQCAICGVREGHADKWGNIVKRLCVDHDHNTGKVRGLLCSRCNQVIGRMEDNPALLRTAAYYLSQSSSSQSSGRPSSGRSASPSGITRRGF